MRFLIFDSSVKELIKAAFEVKKDVFLKVLPFALDELSFDGVKTVVFLNGAFFSGENSCFCDYRKDVSFFDKKDTPDVLYADICFAADDGFRDFLKNNSYRRFVVLFAECAVTSEYGWKSTYMMLGDLREQSDDFYQLVAFLSPFSDCIDECRIAFSSDNTVFVGEDILPEVFSFKAENKSARNYYLYEQTGKYAYKRICIYFNSRSEAAEFRMYFVKRGITPLVADGSLDADELKATAESFISGRNNILLATKSFIPTSLFVPADKVYFCGVPFSRSHLFRCAFSSREPVRIIYCEDDIKRNLRIIESYSEFISDNEIGIKRRESLFDILKIL